MIDCIIRSLIDPSVKEKTVKMFDPMGLTLSEAIRLFIYLSVVECRTSIFLTQRHTWSCKMLHRGAISKKHPLINLKILE